MIRASSELVNMLEKLPKTNEYIFPSKKHMHSNPRDYEQLLNLGRKTAARKLGNPRLLKITFHTLRHWKGTMEYHKTKDILHVQQILGHKEIRNTLIYINLEKAVFKTSNDEFIVKAIDTLEEACKLIEVGFEYVTEVEGKQIFRKRK